MRNIVAHDFFVQAGGGFTDDLDSPDHASLFLRVASEIPVSFTYDAIRRDASRVSRSRSEL